MTLKECYKILGIDKSASLEEIKHAYRRRAFELHPDLNPGLADASQQFQKLTEAYVILTKIAAESSSDSASKETKQEEARAESATQSASSKQKTSKADQASSAQKASDTSSEKQKKENYYAEQQEVLKDILKDSFARRVFEDIYSEIRKKGSEKSKPQEEPIKSVKQESKPATPAMRKPKVPLFPWNELLSFNLDFNKGVGGAVKNWLRNQIDEEQTCILPAKRLVPGARIRLQIRHGLSDDLSTVEVTLPPDFRINKPVRLKGMGKKFGHWQGDLYIRFTPMLSKND